MIIQDSKLYFREELKKYFKSSVNELTIIYLSHLLEKFINIDEFQSDKKIPYLALLIQKILEEPNSTKKNNLMLFLGEHTLFVSSFFPSLIYKRNVNLNYYFSIGSGAYGSLSNNEKNQEKKYVFSDLATNFKFIVNGVSSLQKAPIEINSIYLIEAWSESDNQRYLQELIQRGIFSTNLFSK